MLKVWLPYTQDQRMVGLSPTSAASYSSVSIVDGSPTGGKCGSGCKIFHTATEEFGNSWTIATWVNSAGWSQYNDIISCKNTSASTYCQWYFSIVNAKTFNLGINGGSSTVSVSYNFSANTWYHVAATYDGNNDGKYALYINGDCVKSGTYTSSMYTGCTNVCAVCRATDARGTVPTAGTSKTSDFRIYDHALMDWEIKDLYNCKMFEVNGGLFLEETTNLVSNLASAGEDNVAYDVATWATTVSSVTNKNGVYTFSAYITNTSDHPLNCRLSCYNSAGTGYNTIQGNTIPAGSDGYSTVTCDTTNTSNFNGTIFLYIQNGNAGVDPTNKRFYLKRVQFEEKGHATPLSYGHRDARVADLSNINHNITPYNIVKSGSTFYFNGSNSYISIPGRNLTGGSVSMWVYVQTKQSVQRVLYFDPTSKMGIGFLASGRLCCAMNDTNTNSYNAANFVYGNWNHIVVVYGTNRQPSACYINGVSEAATTESTWWRYSGTNAAIGKRLAGGNADVLLGYIRDVSVYSKQLSAEDVMNLYTHGQ